MSPAAVVAAELGLTNIEKKLRMNAKGAAKKIRMEHLPMGEDHSFNAP
jgi:hypothetical protein